MGSAQYLFTSFTAGRRFDLPILSCVLRPINKIINDLMDGLRKFTFGDESIDEDEEDEWTGLIDYLEQVMTHTVAEAEQRILARIQRSEDLIKMDNNALLWPQEIEWDLIIGE